MRILLLTDNYWPETNAPALRSGAHARRWVEQGEDVTVVTSFPNFPEGKLFKGYRQRFRERRMIDTVDVIRVPTLIFPNAGTLKRILDFMSYMVSASIAGFFVRRPDVVVATSPQFFAAVAGWLVAAVRRRPFVFELRDLWPDSIVAVGAMPESLPIRLLRRLEHFLYRRADLIVTVTHAFRDNLIGRGIDAEKIVVVRNGADLSRFSPGDAGPLRERLGLGGKVVVSYVGTIGMAHGFDILLDAAARLAGAADIVLLIVGSGAERDELRADAAKAGLTNVIFVDRVSHDEILDYWRVSDVALVLLKDQPLFRTVIPSKIFEAMATGTPVISNVKGELEALLAPLGCSVQIEPGSGAALAEAIEQLAHDPQKRRELATAAHAASAGFERNAQADLMLEALRRLAAARRR